MTSSLNRNPMVSLEATESDPMGAFSWANRAKLIHKSTLLLRLCPSQSSLHTTMKSTLSMLEFLELHCITISYAPWCNMHQHLPQKSSSHVGKCTSTMEHMGSIVGCLSIMIFFMGGRLPQAISFEPEESSSVRCVNGNTKR